MADTIGAERGAMNEPLVALENVSVRYALPRNLPWSQSASILAVDRVNLEVRSGETLGIVGETGSGKSTIARLIMGMQAPTDGTVWVAGSDLAKISGPDRLALQRMRQVVLQDPYSSLDPRMRVGNIIAEPLRHGPDAKNMSRQIVRERVAELLGLVGLPEAKADLYPHQFSGGQRQRISIARALATQPRIVVLDEPTSALDVSIRAQILTLLKDLQHRLGLTYVVISHDLVTVAYLATTVAVMHKGRVVEIGPTESIYRRARHPYTIELLASTPTASSAFLDLPMSADDVGHERLPQESCRYADRCALRVRLGRPARCIDEDPSLTSIAADHRVACHFRDKAARFAGAEEAAAHV